VGRFIAKVVDAIIEGIVNIAEARLIVNEAFDLALQTMESMIGNAGQAAVFNDYVVPAFNDAKGPINDGWTNVDIGEYMDFMGEIVNEGNVIMQLAYEAAQQFLNELEELAEQAFEEGFSEREERE
jgi:hypothetical protein